MTQSTTITNVKDFAATFAEQNNISADFSKSKWLYAWDLRGNGGLYLYKKNLYMFDFWLQVICDTSGRIHVYSSEASEASYDNATIRMLYKSVKGKYGFWITVDEKELSLKDVKTTFTYLEREDLALVCLYNEKLFNQYGLYKDSFAAPDEETRFIAHTYSTILDYSGKASSYIESFTKKVAEGYYVGGQY